MGHWGRHVVSEGWSFVLDLQICIFIGEQVCVQYPRADLKGLLLLVYRRAKIMAVELKQRGRTFHKPCKSCKREFSDFCEVTFVIYE